MLTWRGKHCSFKIPVCFLCDFQTRLGVIVNTLTQLTCSGFGLFVFFLPQRITSKLGVCLL